MVLPLGPLVLAAAIAQPAAGAQKRERPARPLFHNAIWLGPIAIPKAFGLSIAYERALHRHVSLGARIDYPFPHRNAAYLQGLGETVALAVWAARPFHGFYGEASLGATHHMLVRAPELSRTALVPGLGIGMRWTFRRGLMLGASVGLRWARLVKDDPGVCTHAELCPLVREGVQIRLGLELGWAFGRGRRHPGGTTHEQT